jgi:hypothetical protein
MNSVASNRERDRSMSESATGLLTEWQFNKLMLIAGLYVLA